MAIKSLKCLKLKNCDIPENSLSKISEHKNLQYLDVSDNERIGVSNI